jgi:L-threonylcarbamoyladenylate synthase
VTDIFNCADSEQRSRGIVSAAGAVKNGGLVVLPTDTVYGVGADAFDSAAVAALLAAKGRGRDMPVPVLVGSWHTIEGLALMVSQSMRDLIRAFWPGALSLVVRQAPSLHWDLGDARGTVMLRMPLHPVAIELLREVGPMAVSSARRRRRRGAQAARRPRRRLSRCRSIRAAGRLDDPRPHRARTAHSSIRTGQRRADRRRARPGRCEFDRLIGPGD